MKKIVACLLAFSLITGITGCSTHTTEQPTSSSSQPASDSTKEESTSSQTNPALSSESTSESDEENKPAKNPFTIDGAYYSMTGIFDPSRYKLTAEEFLEKNPQRKEENLKDNDEIALFIFASLHALEDGEEDLKLPPSVMSSFAGTYLDLRLTVEGNEYLSNYEVNDTDDHMSDFWEGYQDGAALDTSDILYAGGGESRHIVGLFYVRYHDYKEAIETNAPITLTWSDDYTVTFSAEEIEKQASLSTIGDDLKEKGFLD